MITNKLDKIFDLYIAYHILEAYKFLVRNYHPGDQIFFFGALLTPFDTLWLQIHN
jgi:uncharacterized protein (DUF2235 family)